MGEALSVTNETDNKSPGPMDPHRATYECAKAFEQGLDEETLLQRVCDIFVEFGGFRMVRVTYVKPSDVQETIHRMSRAASQHELREALDHQSSEPNSEDAATIAVRTRQRCQINDVLSLPLNSDDRIIGALTFYAANPDQLEPRLVQLLEAFAKLFSRELVGLQTQQHRKETEAALQKRESGLRELIDAIPQHILILRADGIPLFMNQAAMDYHHQSLEESRSIDSAVKVIHPDDVKRMQLECIRGYSGKTPFETQFRLRRKDGQYRWFLFRLNPLRDQRGNIVRWYSSATDIEELKHAELKLRQDEQELRQIVDAIPHSINVLKPDGTLLYSNQAVLDYSGLTMEEVMAPDFRARVFHPEDLEKIWEERNLLLVRGLPFEQEQRVLRRDGQYRWFLVRYNPLRDEHGRIIRWYATGIDIDDRKQAEDRTRNENLALREEIDRSSMFEEIVGTSPVLQTVLSRISKVAPVDSTVLITGETGTGKELIARAIHKRSQRSSHAFVSVNCAAIPRDLIASELFGHEKGAFTGALQRRLGRFELAQGGTIFLDEVGELPIETQIALLRVLQEREFQRVGGNQSIPAEVRVIAATNRDLESTISAGEFRRDLYYRLNVFPIEIPPLRERKEDIPMLVEYFIDRYARKTGKKMRSINKNTLELLQSYSWPGNIRELQNIIERSVIVCETEIFSVDQSWFSVRSSEAQPGCPPFPKGSTPQEKASIEAALAQTGGRVSGSSGAAAILGVPASTLESKIRSLKINKFRFKSG
jgi:formate hydrogenlyase transcriptional activator